MHEHPANGRNEFKTTTPKWPSEAASGRISPQEDAQEKLRRSMTGDA